MIYRALYISTAVGICTNSLLSLADILGSSDRNNRRDDITGLLVAHDGRFLQVLEGARSDLERLIGRVAQDPRHTDIEMLTLGPASARRFPAWSMARVPAPSEFAAWTTSVRPIDVGQTLLSLERAAARLADQAA